MIKDIGSSLWELMKVVISLFIAWCVIEACEKRGLSQIEAVGCTVTAAIVWLSFLVVKVMGVVGDSFHPKLDRIEGQLSDIAQNTESHR